MSAVSLSLRISNVKTKTYVDVVAIANDRYRMLNVPSVIAAQLDLPGYAMVQHKDSVSVTPIQIVEGSSDIIVGQTALTGLCLEIDSASGELRTFMPLLPSVF